MKRPLIQYLYLAGRVIFLPLRVHTEAEFGGAFGGKGAVEALVVGDIGLTGGSAEVGVSSSTGGSLFSGS